MSRISTSGAVLFWGVGRRATEQEVCQLMGRDQVRETGTGGGMW